jgi:hypothetical protein
MSGQRAKPDPAGRYTPTAQEVQGLLRRAAAHPLGTEFLAGGSLDAVAATFGVHAFVVEAARRSGPGLPQGAPAPTLVGHGPGAPVRDRPG